MDIRRLLNQILRFFSPKKQLEPEVKLIQKWKDEETSRVETYPLIFKSENEFCSPDISENHPVFGGLLEKTFEVNLKSVLDSSILILSNPILNTSQNHYELDLLICNNGRYYNIEIDEPYALFQEKELRPIHYIDNGDRARDHELLKEGISVIRLAEEQIARYQDDCVDFVLNVLNENKVNFKNEIPLWSYKDCQNFIYNRYRDSYLPFELKIIGKNDRKRSEKRILQLIIGIVIVYENDRRIKVKLNFTNKVVKTTILEISEFYDILLANEAFKERFRYQLKGEKIEILVRIICQSMYYKNIKFTGYGTINGSFLNIDKIDINNCEIHFPSGFFNIFADR